MRLVETDKITQMFAKKDAELSHSVSAQLLCVCPSIRDRMDILLPLIFLRTRVSKSTVEDKAKLRRGLEYLNGTPNYKYTIGSGKQFLAESNVGAYVPQTRTGIRIERKYI